MNFTNTDSKKLACDGSFLFQMRGAVGSAFPSYGMRGMDEGVFWEVFYQFNSIRYKIHMELKNEFH